LWLALGLVALAALVPAMGASDYQITFLLQLLMMIALAQSWNLISGMTGYVSFGHAAFFGVGAYAGALLLQAGLPWWLALLAAGAIAFVVAIPLGFLTLRLRGPYFAIAMLGLNEVGRIIATLWVSLTSGGDGIPLAPALLPPLRWDYYAMLVLAVIACVAIARIYGSRFGLELRAIREDEGAAEMVGVNTTRNKVLAFVLSTLVPGAVGAVYAMYTSFIDPNSVFSTALNIQMIVIVMLGGTGTLWGPVLGAVIVVTLREWLWASFPALHLLLMGVGIIVIVLFLPDGVLSLLRKRKTLRPEAAEAGKGVEP
jgi:branched-chain amino acid transport system permease protein